MSLSPAYHGGYGAQASQPLAQPSHPLMQDRSAGEAFRTSLLYILTMSGAMVIVEPSPYEAVAALAMLAFLLVNAVRLNAFHLPLIFITLFYCIALSISSLMVLDKPKVMIWTLVSWYLCITGIFFAMILTHNTAERFDALMRGWVIAALIAAILGILGYLKLIPGADLFTRYDRLKGTFNDPNVAGPFFIAPMLVLIQQFFFGRFWGMVKAAAILSVLMLALLFTFSRGAWLHFVVSLAVMVVLLFITTSRSATRTRIILLILLGAVGLLALLGIVLSIDSVGEQFSSRANLNQSYDNGPMGRFGRHIFGAQLALGEPLGIGPLQFASRFGEDTHNVYLNSFMAGGWVAGLTYLVMTVMTLVVGLRACFERTPWQAGLIAIFGTYVGLVVEGAIIDSEHWRHFWLVVGLIWGLALANRLAVNPLK